MKPAYLLDTDTCSYAIRQKPFSVAQRLAFTKNGQVAVSVMTYSELLYGACRHPALTTLGNTIRQFISGTQLLPWSIEAAEHFARIRQQLTSDGTPIGILDMQIAAHALALDCTLVTNNTKHFSNIKNLHLENWAI